MSRIIIGDFNKPSTGSVRPKTSKRQFSPIFINQQYKSKEELSLLSARMMHAQESERKRIARELHDGLNQSMAMLEVELGMILKQLPRSASSVRPDLNRLRVRVQGLSDEVRQISHRLHPAVLDHSHLVPALKNLCKEFRVYHRIPILFVCDGKIEKVPFNTSVCLYRVTQETLCNIVKHAQATEVVVSLTLENGELKLSITDDGRGFDVVNPKHGAGLGLISMEERARLVGGRFSIDSQLGSGTRVEVVVPAKEAWQWKVFSETPTTVR